MTPSGINGFERSIIDDPSKVIGKSITQVVTMLADGKLTDNGQTAPAFRDFLNNCRIDQLESYINHWFAGSSRGLMRDHAISRLWWYHRLCTRIKNRSADETLDLLFFNSDYRSSMLERNTTSAITEVVSSIIEITEENRKKGVSYNREKFRAFMKSLDLLAGRSRLSVLNKEQLKTKLATLYSDAYK